MSPQLRLSLVEQLGSLDGILLTGPTFPPYEGTEGAIHTSLARGCGRIRRPLRYGFRLHASKHLPIVLPLYPIWVMR